MRAAREVLSGIRDDPSDLRGAIACAADGTFLFVGIASIVLFPLVGKILGAMSLHIALARLFVLGHDACHGSLFRSRYSNAIVGRILFLPTLTPYSLWHVGHNVAHHGFTNFKGRDFVWAPFSSQEWRLLPKWRQWLERLYRTPHGIGLYYLIELWWKKLIFPSRTQIGARRAIHLIDCVLVVLAAVGYLSGLLLAAGLAKQPIGQVIAFGFFVPFLMWNYLMAVVVLVHHTHPQVQWVDDKKSWALLSPANDLTICVNSMPLQMHRVLHHIMDHSAHHLDAAIPHYRLRRSRLALEHVGIRPMLNVDVTYSYMRFVLNRCQLFDFDARRWIRFDEAGTQAEHGGG